MIKISASLVNTSDKNNILLSTKDDSHSISIPSKENGEGLKANGGELLFLALATCYCNDIYREAKKRDIEVIKVEVECEGEFDPIPGSAAKNMIYNARVMAEASEEEILDLMRHTDTVAEIQNTLRDTTSISLGHIAVIPKK